MNALISAAMGTQQREPQEYTLQIEEENVGKEEEEIKEEHKRVLEEVDMDNITTVVQRLDFNEDETAKNEDSNDSSEMKDTSIVDCSNLGVLSDFSEKSPTSASLGGEVEGMMEVIHACMTSISKLDLNKSPTGDDPPRKKLVSREDLPIILKTIVENCRSRDLKSKDIMYAALAGLAHYIALSTDSTQLLHHVNTELNSWLTELLSLPDYSPYLFDDAKCAVTSLTESLLRSHYPAIADEGLFALYTKCPVIYMTPPHEALYSTHILTTLHLPKSIISIVPCAATSPNSRTMDIRALERLIKDDVACGKMPFLVFTTIGTPTTGHMDNIPAIKEVCDRYGIWIHGEGTCTPLLALQTRPDSLTVFSHCDSISVSCGTILDDVMCDTCCLLVDSAGHVTHTASLQTLLPVWVMLQEEGLTNIRTRIEQSYRTCAELYRQLRQIDNIQVLEYPLTGHVICFRYYSQLDNLPDLDEELPMNRLMSKLTMLLLVALKTDLGSDNVDHVTFSNHIDVIRLTPLTSHITLESVDHIIATIVQQIAVFESSLRHRYEFNCEIQSRDNFLLIFEPEHPSIGSFQYLPKYLQDEDACSTPEGTEELNDVNTNIADYLASKWEHLTTRQVGQYVVMTVPMVADGLDTYALLEDIIKTAPTFENNSKYLVRMSAIIRRGIELASEELQLESENQFYEKGIMRQIPMFGPIINWMSPIEDRKIVGRSFSLHSGEIQTSHSVYNSVLGSPVRSRTFSGVSADEGSITERRFPKVIVEHD